MGNQTPISGGTVTTGQAVQMNPIQNDVSVTVLHQLGRTPDGYTCYIECMDADRGYDPGDRIEHTMQWSVTPWVSNSEVGLVSKSSGGIAITSKTNRSQRDVADSKWKMVCVPYVFG